MSPWKHYMFVDTETSDLPQDLQTSPRNTEKWPYIVQIAWFIYDLEGKLIRKRSYYIKAVDYRIRKSSLRIHGITEKMATDQGVERKEALKAFYKDLQHYKPLIIGHFIQLDLGMIEAGFIRAGLKNILPEYHAFCTMKATTEYIHEMNRNYPRLPELYESLFKRKMENAHTAEGDARAVAECFFELRQRGEADDHLIQRQQALLKRAGKERKPLGCGLAVVLILLLSLILLPLWLSI